MRTQRTARSRHGADSWPVVVVGGGPAGLVAAITLARLGIEVLVVNRRVDVAAHPRATSVSVRTMELLRSWGLEEEIRAGGDEVEWRMLLAPTLAQAADGQVLEVGYPNRAESARVSPTRPASVPQDHFESVLLDHLRTLPSAQVEMGVELIGLQPQDEGCRLEVRDPTGAPVAIGARYVIGADGGRGIVRRSVGIDAWVSDRFEEALSVLVHAPVWDLLGTHRYGIYGVDTPQPATFLPAGQGDRWLYAQSWDPTVERVEDYPAARLVDLVRAAAGAPDLPVRVVSVGSFAFTAALADRFRSADVFLIGDAAHRVTPRGGTGLNSAVADGFNLGWKLGWVLLGWAPASLLDTYESERRPVVEHNLRRSLDPMGSRRPVAKELAMDLGGRIAHRWLPHPTGRRSTLDLLGPGLTLLTTGERVVPRPPAGVSAPITTHRLDRRTAAALGADRAGGLLVRPDGLVLNAAPSMAALTLDDLAKAS